MYTLLLFFPSAGVHLRGARKEEEEDGGGEPRFSGTRAVRIRERAGGRAGGVPRGFNARLGLNDSLLLPVPDAPIQDLRLRAGGLALAARRHRSRALAEMSKPKKLANATNDNFRDAYPPPAQSARRGSGGAAQRRKPRARERHRRHAPRGGSRAGRRRERPRHRPRGKDSGDIARVSHLSRRSAAETRRPRRARPPASSRDGRRRRPAR